MEMYTMCYLNCIIDKANENDIAVLDAMCHGDAEYEMLTSKQKKFTLFNTTRWKGMLRSGSAYFDFEPYSLLDRLYFINGESEEGSCNVYQLSVSFNIKNYEHEIEHFIEWIKTLSSTKGLVGYTRYELDDLPSPIYF